MDYCPDCGLPTSGPMSEHKCPAPKLKKAYVAEREGDAIEKALGLLRRWMSLPRSKDGADAELSKETFDLLNPTDGVEGNVEASVISNAVIRALKENMKEILAILMTTPIPKQAFATMVDPDIVEKLLTKLEGLDGWKRREGAIGMSFHMTNVYWEDIMALVKDLRREST